MNPHSPAFTVRCRMTCLGGSERGECECRHPRECEMQSDPGYPAAREEAKARMLRYFLNGDHS
jgi:hypothetical protein